MIIDHYFKVHFVQKQAKRKFATFDENHGLTPFEKISTWRLCKIRIFSLGRLGWSANIISMPILFRNN